MIERKSEPKTVEELIDSGVFGNKTEEVKRALRERGIGGYR